MTQQTATIPKVTHQLEIDLSKLSPEEIEMLVMTGQQAGTMVADSHRYETVDQATTAVMKILEQFAFPDGEAILLAVIEKTVDLRNRRGLELEQQAAKVRKDSVQLLNDVSLIINKIIK